MISEERSQRLEHIRLVGGLDWREAKRMAETLASETAREEVPQRAARVRAVVNRFASQIAAMGEDPGRYLLQQETDLMREGVYTNPLFTRTVA